MGIYNILRTNCPGINVGKGTKPTGVVNNFMYDIWFEQTGHINLPALPKKCSGAPLCSCAATCGTDEAFFDETPFTHACGPWPFCPGGPGAACETNDHCLFDEMLCDDKSKTCIWKDGHPGTGVVVAKGGHTDCNYNQHKPVSYGKGPFIAPGEFYPSICSSECIYPCT